MRRIALVTALFAALALVVSGCANSSETPGGLPTEPSPTSQQSTSTTAGGQTPTQKPGTTADTQVDNNIKGDGEMRMSIGGTDVSVEWERNQAVDDLRALAAEGPITVELSMYGGFEQVGPLGSNLTASDTQMTTESGDIVLYAGNQISVFYGPNSWAYTKLGHITDKTANEMEDLLGNGDTTITITTQ